MKVDATFERAPLTLSSLYMLEGMAEKAVEVLISNNFMFSCVQMHNYRSVHYPPNQV